MDHSPAVDRTVLEALSARLGDKGPAFVVSLVGTWQGESTHRREELLRVAAAGDADALARVVHTVRSAAASLGARALSELCGAIEDAVRTGKPVDVATEADRVLAELDRADSGFEALAQEHQQG